MLSVENMHMYIVNDAILGCPRHRRIGPNPVQKKGANGEDYLEKGFREGVR